MGRERSDRTAAVGPADGVAVEERARGGEIEGERSAVLAFQGVTVTCGEGIGRRTVLDGISFELGRDADAGIYGSRRSGKSTLLRVACGVERAERGVVRFDGVDLGRLRARGRARLLRDEVALLRQGDREADWGETALDLIATGVGSAGLTLGQARRVAQKALERVGVAGCAQEPVARLPAGERARVMLARAVARKPRLLLVDEPAPMPSIGERERLVALMRELAREAGMALLIASEDLGMVAGMQTVMALSGGELRLPGGSGKVVPLRKAGAAGGGSRA